jgi:colanic acid biosynthesis protein WcaH
MKSKAVTTAAIEIIEQHILNPTEGLPDEVFYFISRTTPLVNVDLLIKDEQRRTLLAWRNDPYAGQGWHIPGGIVRFKETFEERIRKVAETELGIAIHFEPEPIALNQLIHKERDTRGHFISLLYRCHLSSSFIPPNKGLAQGDRGFLQWHNTCPDNLISYHDIYYNYITGDSDR